MIWGTDINVGECANTFQSFVETFAVGNEFEAYYLRQLEIIHRVEVFTLDLNCAHLEATRSTWTLYKQLKQCPQEILLIMDQVINDIYVSLYGQREGQPAIQVRVFGLTEMSRMRDLDPSHIDQVIKQRGRYLFNIIPYLLSYVL